MTIRTRRAERTAFDGGELHHQPGADGNGFEGCFPALDMISCRSRRAITMLAWTGARAFSMHVCTTGWRAYESRRVDPCYLEP